MPATSLAVPPAVREQLDRIAPDAVVRHARLLHRGQSHPQRLLRGVGSRVVRHVRRADPAGPRAEPTFLVVKADGATVRARVVDRFRSDEVWGEQAARVADALAAHGVDHVYVSTDRYRRRVVAVPRSQRARAMRALAVELGGTATLVASLRAGRPFRTRPLTARVPRLSDTLRVYQVLATPAGAFLSGVEMGCDLQFWHETGRGHGHLPRGEGLPAGTLVGPRTLDPVPETVERQTVASCPVDGRDRPVAADLARPHLLQHLRPVDVVYTWVDGADPGWRSRRDAALRSADLPLHDLATNDSRYTSHDELRYSLRSLEMYAPWVRHVYLVTDDQVPDWLDLAGPRLTVVDHRRLFGGRGRLPTFNSHAIESQLHRIEGLAENFLYLNDDVFFGRPVDPGLFVLGNGLAKIFFSSVKVGSGPQLATDLPITSAAKNNRDVLAAASGRTTLHKFQHAPYSLRRSVMHELDELLGDQVEATASATFRSPTDLSLAASLGLAYGYQVGKAVPGRLAHLYADIARPDTPHRLRDLLARRDRDVFCLNDHDSSAVPARRQQDLVRGFLDAYFPLPSSFER